VATRKKQQLDVNLTRIKDDAVRDAIDSIVRFVNNSSASLEVTNRVSGNEISNNLGSGKIDRLGRVLCKGIEVERDSGFLKFAIRSGELAAFTGQDIEVSSGQKILGALGMTTTNDGSGNYYPMHLVDSAIAGIGFVSTATDKLRIFNYDIDDPNTYRLVVFYTER
jgi:hypothetical protein